MVNKSKGNSNKIKIIFIMTLIVLSLAINLSMNFRKESLMMLEKNFLFDKKFNKFFFITGLDDFLEKAAPTGNLLLKFKGFGNLKRESDTDASLLIYFRAVYRLYPRKVFAVPKDVIVNTGEDLSNNPFNPTKEWMQNNNVKTLITLTQDVKGRIHQSVVKFP